MGIIKAAVNSIGGVFADSWLEAVECKHMGDSTVFCRGTFAHNTDKRYGNSNGTANTVSNGSIIHVGENQFMILVDGGKVVDYSAEPGYYKVQNSASPSLFNGQFGASLKEAWERIKFSGTPSSSQRVYYINLQEIKGIKFGTANAVNYFDNFYNAELFLRSYGTFSIKITNPLLFYAEAIPKNKEKVDITDINEQYLAEFLDAFQSALNQLSADGVRVSHVTSKSRELSQYMSSTLDESWNSSRGMQIQSVGIASLSYDDESKELINMRNRGAMLSDPTVREGYVQGSAARGVEAAGSNAAGATTGFMGYGMASQTAGGFVGAASSSNQAQFQQQQAAAQQAAADAAANWNCPNCSTANKGKFCKQCGTKRPEAASVWFCTECGTKNDGLFCEECGKAKE